MLRFPLGWMAWDLTHSAFWVGVFSAVLLLPAIFLAPLFGVLSDRVNPRNGVLTTMFSQGALAALITLMVWADWLGLNGLLVVALVMGIVTSAHQPMRLALLPKLVSRARLPSAIGLSAIVFNVSRVLGPAVAGGIIARAEPEWALAIAACLFMGAWFALLRVHIEYQAVSARETSVLTELIDGLKFVAGHRAIGFVLALTLMNALLGRTVLELLPAISGKLLDGTAVQLAWLTAASGGGSVIGGILLTQQRDRESTLMRLVLTCLTLAALILLPIYWLATPWLLTLAVGLLSLVTTTVGIGGQALTQLTVAEQYRGRVMSLWSLLIMGGPAIGSFVVGALADILGFVSTLMGVSIAALLVLGFFWRQTSMYTPSR